MLLLAGAAVLAAILLAVAGIATLLAQDHRRGPAEALPTPSVGAASAPATGGPAAPPGTSGATPPANPSGDGAAGPGAAGPAVTEPEPAGPPPGAHPGATENATLDVAPPAALLPRPAAARTGPIARDGGRCLAIPEDVPPGHRDVRVAACDGSAGQQWTLDPEGTLTMDGKCAEPTGDGTIRVSGCGHHEAAQWRAGSGGTLVDLATRQCMTDAGTGALVATCTGEPSQHWTLP